MLLQHITNNRWWHPCMLAPGDSAGDSFVENIWRNNNGDIIHIKGNHFTNTKIRPPELKYVRPQLEWNLDFVQGGTLFHTENMRLTAANSLLFVPSVVWWWRPKLNVCHDIVISLRIGGYLADVWKMEDAALDLDDRNTYILRGKCEKPNLRLNDHVLDVSHSVGLGGRHRTTFLLKKDYNSAIRFEMYSPVSGKAPDRYAYSNSNQCRNLLLDIVRCRGTILKKISTI